MTDEEAGRLKPGDKIRVLRKNWTADNDIAIVEDPPLYINIDANFDYVTQVRYFKVLNKKDNLGVMSHVNLEDCELYIEEKVKKCSCDIMSLMQIGCKCGGE